ncbi:MAG: tRNA (N(6)-L-threonylcarbamoyladenosine(37)-C(2))-methylthiotransferase MtaB [Pelagibacteraceae bacterium]|jgi:threonylcarbamoyladenosine tRNA methylthiotransferase MtaB|nr:tRNA (N(6)-L-threonylcarbamoyladenosine(37)-C(2))-methylthiotransferase MtaB [Pelagibacteraceae bacterium]HJL58474.1 tRNA (N(6)-L-threonylcarbamoyladenosine(37)-C(2))-methylthiotransferase MtaB [Alphaproteobacteria bacterium]MBO6466695.1 tRNA (N(6)-L-threonylcarbamoyladenosine(37)-C(2))-methylthiotransferase MtaB [Pelagibacteraceae bacterium]MBO6467963.1 tRNA (N(6)-L-threonylcarbamoyladenosine(37)-C(2))-methylthiotransferase MtaB [Pelagibacteraceae bacterium]MBO6469243.1 tRNA (N(6)-L-threony
MQKEKLNIINLGCRLNICEGEVIKSLASKNELDNFTIINSCAVTQKAEKKVNYEIRKAKKKFPNKKIVLTGCAAQISPQKYSAMEEIDYVIGNNEKLNSKTWSSIKKSKSVQVRDIFKNNDISHHLIEGFEGKTRAFIEIQQGCDHRCTFCIIPFGRGNNRSIPVDVIINRIKLLVQNGYKEVVLTGVDITDYGKDLPRGPNIFQLVKRILSLVPELKQLRFSSIDCAEISSDFWPLLENHRVMPHFHLSLQAGNDLILKRMKRRHTRKQAIDFCHKVKKIRSDVVFGADIIAGFPTETDVMFKESIKLIDECNLTHLHIFPFSPRQSTPAASMPQISKEVIKNRAKILRDCGNKNLVKYLNQQIGRKATVLVEEIDPTGSYGKSQHFTKIHIDKELPKGLIVNCKIYKMNENILKAKLI